MAARFTVATRRCKSVGASGCEGDAERCLGLGGGGGGGGGSGGKGGIGGSKRTRAESTCGDEGGSARK